MNNPGLYHENNSVQKKDVLQYLEEYGKKIKWKTIDEKVIDIGCGDGSTTNVLKNYMPANFGKLVGCDISVNMVKFASKNYKQERISFIVLDIEGSLPEKLRGGFDHAFSFFTLHWIKQQERAFTNIHSLLADDGECLLVFLASLPLFKAFGVLARTKKWNSWLQDIDRYNLPYQGVQEPATIVKELMEKVGFSNINVKCEDKLFIYNCQDTFTSELEALAAITHFKMPENIHKDFMEDCLEVMENMKLIEKGINDVGESTNVLFKYSLIVAHANKKMNEFDNSKV